MVIKKINWTQWFTLIIKLAVAGGLVTWLFLSGKVDFAALKEINRPQVWFFCCLLFLCTLLANVKRWQILLSTESIILPYWEVFNISLIGIFFNFVIPGGVGGDVVKGAYLIKKYSQKKWFIGWSILLDRALGLLALLVYSGSVGIFYYSELKGELQSTVFVVSISILSGFFIGLFILIFSPKQSLERWLLSHPFLSRTLYPCYHFFKKPQKTFFPFILSLVGQAFAMSIFYVLAQFLQIDIPLWAILLLFPFGFLAMIIPISPAGLGVGQTAFYFLFEETIGHGTFGVLAVTFCQIVQFLIGLLGGVLFILRGKGGRHGSKNKNISE